LQPFIQSLKDFYQKAFNVDSQNGSVVPVLSSLEVRRELYKLFYDKNEFAINSKADAHEAFDNILGLVHGWIASSLNNNKTKQDLFALQN
jgi:hypothetical protein